MVYTSTMEYQEKLNGLHIKRARLDKFFTMFLDRYSHKMDPENVDTPVWKLYRKSLAEYDALSKEITATKYWLTKSKHV